MCFIFLGEGVIYLINAVRDFIFGLPWDDIGVVGILGIIIGHWQFIKTEKNAEKRQVRSEQRQDDRERKAQEIDNQQDSERIQKETEKEKEIMAYQFNQESKKDINVHIKRTILPNLTNKAVETVEFVNNNSLIKGNNSIQSNDLRMQKIFEFRRELYDSGIDLDNDYYKEIYDLGWDLENQLRRYSADLLDTQTMNQAYYEKYSAEDITNFLQNHKDKNYELLDEFRKKISHARLE